MSSRDWSVNFLFRYLQIPNSNIRLASSFQFLQSKTNNLLNGYESNMYKNIRKDSKSIILLKR